MDMDLTSRTSIIEDVDVNLIVEAGAGSGKTTMLVNRMVAMVEQGKDIRKICAITFTKAAANEFYDRFRNKLIKRSNPNCTDDEDQDNYGKPGYLPVATATTRAFCEKALENIDLCFMGTIDSFCTMILSEHPSEARIPSNAVLISKAEEATFYRQMYVKICQGDCGSELMELARLFCAFQLKPEEAFVVGMNTFMNSRNVDYQYTPITDSDLDTIFATQKQALISLLDCLEVHRNSMYSRKGTSKQAWTSLSNYKKIIEKSWNSNLANVIRTIRALKNLQLDMSTVDSSSPDYTLLVNNLKLSDNKSGNIYYLNSETILDELKSIQYSLSMEFMQKCVVEIEKQKIEKGLFTYFDFLLYLRNMLKRDAEADGKLIRYIYNRHSYYLIDEFQDTNPMQSEIFFYLTAECPKAKWAECIPRSGSLFIVGDPKQSIYRFRGADVAAFMRIKELFNTGVGKVIQLTRNYRSTKHLCEYFNTVFTAMLPTENNNQSKYSTIPTADKPSVNCFQGIYTFKGFMGKQYDDGKKIGNIIKKIVNNPNFTVIKNGKLEQIQYSDIMIITASKSKLKPIMQELNSIGIPTMVEGNVPFDTNDALKAVTQIYGVIANPYDKVTIYNALRGIIFNISEQEIMQYVDGGGKLELGLKTDSKVDIALNKLRGAYNSLRKMSPAAVFSSLLEAFEIYNIVDAEKIEVLYYTQELLRNAETHGVVVSLLDGAFFLEQLMSGNTEVERCLSLDGQNNCVHIANLHKIKGLQNKVVILATSYERGTRESAASRIENNINSTKGYVFSLKVKGDNFADIVYFDTNEFEDKAKLEMDSAEAENLRLVYVAATRAENVLIISDFADYRGWTNKWKYLLTPATQDFLNTFKNIPDGNAIVPVEVDSQTLYLKAKQENVLNNRLNEAGTYNIELPSKIKLPSKLSDEIAVEDIQDSAQSKSEVHKIPELLGTMTHRLMELLAITKNRLDADKTIKEIICEYRTPRSEGYEADLLKALTEVANTIRNGGYPQENLAPQDLLNEVFCSPDTEVHCEVPFCYKDESDGKVVVWNGVIDLLYCKNGKWHIIDYKTNADGSGLDAHYAAQLQAYCRAIKATTGITVEDALIYHIPI